MPALLFSHLRKAYAATGAVRDVPVEGLPEAAGGRADSLSKGMQQKVQIAGALLHDPAILVMDEPFTGLDPLNTVLVKDLLRERRDRGSLVILSTHQMPMVEELCDRVAMIDRGRLVLYGNLDEIRRSHGESIVLVDADADLGALPIVERVERQGALHPVVPRDGARPPRSSDCCRPIS